MLRKIITGLLAAGVMAGATLAVTSSADAKQFYPYWKYHQHYYNNYNNGYYGGYGYDNGGGAVAAGILGFIGGALLSSAIHDRGVGYCETHFRTYSSTSHQYMGYDGNPHYCYD